MISLVHYCTNCSINLSWTFLPLIYLHCKWILPSMLLKPLDLIWELTLRLNFKTEVTETCHLQIKLSFETSCRRQKCSCKSISAHHGFVVVASVCVRLKIWIKPSTYRRTPLMQLKHHSLSTSQKPQSVLGNWWVETLCCLHRLHSSSVTVARTENQTSASLTCARRRTGGGCGAWHVRRDEGCWLI